MKTESKEQSKVINFMKKKGWMYIKLIRCSPAGMPDLIFLKNGKTIFIEMKKDEKSKVSALQKYWIENLQKNGFNAFFLFGFDEKKLNEIA